MTAFNRDDLLEAFLMKRCIINFTKIIREIASIMFVLNWIIGCFVVFVFEIIGKSNAGMNCFILTITLTMTTAMMIEVSNKIIEKMECDN